MNKFPTMLTILGCKISMEPMPDSLSQKLPQKDLKKYISLLETAQLNPHGVFEEIKELQQKYPNLPELLNLLTYVTIRKRDLKKADELIVENYEKNPNYLYARINYADLALRKKQWKKIPEIFSSFNLKDLYPEKQVFHYTEFRGFMVTLGFYHHAMNKKNEARECLDHAKKVDPDHPSVQLLEKKLKPNLLQRLLRLGRKK